MSRLASSFGAIAIVLGLASPGLAADFNSVVETVLAKQPQVTDLPPDRQRAMIACVKKVLANVPAGQKRRVEEAKDYNQMEDRFGELVLADRAKFKQQITTDCGEIAVKK